MAENRMGMLHFLAVAGFILLVVVGAMVIYPARLRYDRQRQAYERIRQETERKRAERNALQQEVAELKTSPEAIERVARTKFRLCKEGELIMYYKPIPGQNQR